jgi:hypothetical protein
MEQEKKQTDRSSPRTTKQVPSRQEIDWENSDPEYWEQFAGGHMEEYIQEFLDHCPGATRAQAIRGQL